MPFLGTLFSSTLGKLIPVAILGAAALAGWLYISHLRGEVALQAQQIAVLAQTAKADAAAVAKLKADNATANASLAQLQGEQQDWQAQIKSGMDDILSAAPTAGGNDNVAPVLTNALNKLRSIQAAAK